MPKAKGTQKKEPLFFYDSPIKGSRKNGLGGEGRLLYAPVIPLPDHFVTEQQQTVRRNGDSCGWIKMTFSLCKIHFRTHMIS